MNGDLRLVLILLLACVAMMAANRPRIDAVALLALIALPLLGVVTLPETLAGFSDPNVVLIAAMFVVGEGLTRTGVAFRIGELLVNKAGASETRLLALLMLSVAGLGAFMSSTGVVAIFIPVVLSIAARLQTHPGRLMMPLSFAGLMSGMLTLVATPPNMVLDSALKREGHAGFGFFSFTPIGAVVLVLGVCYMLVARRFLSGPADASVEYGRRRGFRELIDSYQVAGRTRRLRVRPTSPLVGRTLENLHLRENYRMNILSVQRHGRFYDMLLSPNATFEIHGDDILLVDIAGPANAPLEIPAELDVKELPLEKNFLTDQSREVGMAEVMLPPGSGLIGKTVRQAKFRTMHATNVVGLQRNGVAFDGNLLEEKLKLGDTLLVVGSWKAIRQLQFQRRDFLVLSLPAEADSAAPALRQAPFALLSIAVMIALMVTGVVPNVLAALVACMLMGAFRCIDLDSAYKAIHWQSLIVIVGIMPFAAALQKTGAIQLAVDSLMHVVGDASPRAMLAGLFVITSVSGLFISNTATAVLMAPLALTLANYAGASPRPFAMTVALAASAAFMTPVSSPVNTLVLGPGQYRFNDFVKVGVPFTLLVLVVTVTLVPLLFPLY